MTSIQINRLQFVCALWNLGLTINDIDSTYSDTELVNEDSKAFSSYIEGFIQLHDIMNTYKTLAYKDIKAMQSIESDLSKMDWQLQSLWNRK